MEATPRKETRSPKAEVRASKPSKSTRIIDVSEMYADTDKPAKKEPSQHSSEYNM